MDKRELLRWTGSIDQVLGSRKYVLLDGKANGIEAIDVFNMSGIEMQILLDRGMDIGRLTFKGTNIGFLSKTGLVGSKYFCEDGAKGFMKNFYVGFLTTCGLTYMGSPCTENGRELGLHGLISNTPAENYSKQVVWSGDSAKIVVSGDVRQSEVFGENIVLHRAITLEAEKNEFTVEDDIENQGHRPEPFMMLYHMNYGFPFLNQNCVLNLPALETVPRDLEAAKGQDTWMVLEEPDDNREEQCYYHTLKKDENNTVSYSVLNEDLGITVSVSYDATNLPAFTQWKCNRSGEYVLGLEPGTNHVNGRAIEKYNKRIVLIQPGEIKHNSIKISIT